MKLLIDTCVFLYLAANPKKLSQVALELVESNQYELYLSSISCYEILIKYSNKKLKLAEPPSTLIPMLTHELNIIDLPVSYDDIIHVEVLPNIHQDPFDRIIIAQSLNHEMIVLTPDSIIHKYDGIKVLW